MFRVRQALCNWRCIALLLICFACDAFGATDISLSATFEPGANYPYSTDPGDKVQLTDGERAVGHFWTSKKAVGWMNSGPVRVLVRLSKVARIHKVCVGSAQGQHAGVSFPERIDVFSGDGKGRYLEIGELMSASGIERDGQYTVRDLCMSTPGVEAAEILLVVVPRGRYFFADEVFLDAETSSSDLSEKYVIGVRKEDVGAAVKKGIEETNELNSARFYLTRLSARTSATERDSEEWPDSNALETLRKSSDAIRLTFNLAGKIARKRFGEDLIAASTVDKWADFSPVDIPETGSGCGSTSLDVRQGEFGSAVINVTNTGRRSRLFASILHDINRDESPASSLAYVEMVNSKALRRPVGDALVPVSGGLEVEFGETKQIWVNIAAGAVLPGKYKYTLKVSREEAGREATICNINVTVYPANTLAADHPRVNVWGYLNSAMLKCCVVDSVADMRSHFVNVFIAHPAQIPSVTNSRANGVQGDKALRDLVRQLSIKSHGGEQLLLYMGLNDQQRRTFGGLLVGSPAWVSAVRSYVERVSEIIAANGLSKNQVAFYPIDEPKTDEEVLVLKLVSRLIKDLDKQSRVFSTLGEMNAADVVAVLPSVDVFQVLKKDLQDIRVNVIQAAGKEIWSYEAEGGGKGAAPVGFSLMQSWRAFSFGLQGVGVWSYSDAGQNGDAWNDFDDRRPDFSLVYVRNGRMISSKRWEAWREGVQDFSLLKEAKRGENDGTISAGTVQEIVRRQTSASDISERTLSGVRQQLREMIK
jgi:hypothetical protein